MDKRKLDKNLIFYLPGSSGAIFTYRAGYAVNDLIIAQTIDQLKDDMDIESEIKCVEDRRRLPRVH